MKLPDARKILGISPYEDLRTHLPEIKRTREHLAKMVQDATDEKLASGYRLGLADYDQAVAAVHAHLASTSVGPLGSGPLPSRGRKFAYLASGLLLLTGLGAGSWNFLQGQRLIAPEPQLAGTLGIAALAPSPEPTIPERPPAKPAAVIAAQEIPQTNLQKAQALLKLATDSDNGQINPQAQTWLDEADALAPNTPEITAAIAKFSAYGRIFRVPSDYATPQEALAEAKDNARIILTAGTWQGPLVVDAAITIVGAGAATTTVECAAADGSVITLGPGAKGAKISGITFRHTTPIEGSDRFSAALVRGAEVEFTDCRFTQASGHGLVVIEGGGAKVSGSQFTSNGWDGAAAIGQGSRLEISTSESLTNLEHGFESWAGASITLSNNRCEGNGRNGIHADSGSEAVTITGNQLTANKEFGLVLGSATRGEISANSVRSNLLGGLVLRATAAGLPVTTNQISINQGAGLILETGLDPAAYTSNTVVENQDTQILSSADLSAAPPTVTPDPAVPRAVKIPPGKKPRRKKR